MSLYHFTCADHGEPGIRKERQVRPNWHPFFGNKIAWFTDDPAPSPDAVGLTSNMQRCDRMAYRVTVPDHADIVPWVRSVLRATTPIGAVNDLELYGYPDRWFVSVYPVPAGDVVRRPKAGWSA